MTIPQGANGMLGFETWAVPRATREWTMLHKCAMGVCGRHGSVLAAAIRSEHRDKYECDGDATCEC